MSRANQWFVPGDGIAREVITADIQRYLGPDALVRPGPGTGEYEGRPGYWITAYRTLTTQMIQDLKGDSLRWQQEQGRQEGGRRGQYQDSDTHAARQHWGPTEGGYTQSSGREQSSRPSGGYSNTNSQYSDSAYTTTPGTYGSHTSPYAVQGASTHAAPRTQPATYGSYQQPPSHPGYGTPAPSYGYSQHSQQPQQVPPQDYNRHPPPPSRAYAPPRYFGYFDEYFLVPR
ncbi:hypothetical protein EJ04DRAFT_451336 [Polyplosphaeria fusca]|uniref:Uncharacterized protein n=1 Tax=Polyplosphaeria fusca TaxID=682080 RepID=A0A9P4UW16_9PLEO|nr:hypothetical protein EJ04DRAFT_451336 [Polyplosphaeria fusca]